jgi:hypothetical protein
MDDVTRRTLLAATAAGGIVTAARAAGAQTNENESVPQPRRRGEGGTDPGPRNLARDRQNPDLLVPPSTDHGTLPNLRFSFSDAHMRLEPGGWTRQVTQREFGVSKDIAGVNMRLNAAAFASCIGTRLPNGPTCCTAAPVSQPSIPRDVVSSMTSASAISGIFHLAFRIRFRGLIRTAANFS